VILFHSWQWNYIYLRLKFSPQLGGFVSINSPQKVGNFIENCWTSQLSKGEFFPLLGSYSASVQQPPASSNSNANQSLVKMVVLDGIVMGSTVCFIFVLSVNIILIFYFNIVHLMVAYKT